MSRYQVFMTERDDVMVEADSFDVGTAVAGVVISALIFRRDDNSICVAFALEEWSAVRAVDAIPAEDDEAADG